MRQTAPQTPRPSDATREAIRAAIMADLAPVPVLSLRVRTLGAALGAIASVAVAALTSPMTMSSVVASRKGPILASFLVVLSAVLVTPVILAPARAARVGVEVRVGILAFFILGWALYSGAGAHAWVAESALGYTAIACGMRGFIAGSVGGAVAVLAWYKADPWMPRTSGALIGAAAGAVGSAVVHAACDATEGAHVAVGHWLAIPILAVIGALIAPRLLSP